MAFTNFKSDAPTRLQAKRTRGQETEQARRAAYKAVETRDRMQCRACDRRVVKTASLVPERLEHHHVNGRGAKDSETTKNLCLLCKACHDDRHVTRTLTITGNADKKLRFTKAGRTWRN